MAINIQDLIDIDLLAYFKSQQDLVFDTKVDKVAGKGLSENDFTADFKSKLQNIENNAQENKIESVEINGSNLTIVNKAVNIPLVTDETPGLMSPSQKEKLDIASALPSGGDYGDMLIKASREDYDAMWVAPAQRAEQDNTLPISSAAVYTEIGNINALLATI